jgi:citrate synthase
MLQEAVEILRKERGGEPKPEDIFWLLLTGSIPNKQQRDEFRVDLVSRMALDQTTIDIVKSMPKDLHPMSKLSAGMLLLQKHSKFAAAYSKGVKKTELWE